MKKTVFFLSTLSVLFLISCFGDDDGESNPQDVNLIGEWVLESATDGSVGCTDNGPTTLEFRENNKVIIKSFLASVVQVTGDCDDRVYTTFCALDKEGSPEPQGDYTENKNSGVISFDSEEEGVNDPDPTDDFIPPPTDVFSYRVDGNIMTVETIDFCLKVTYVYRKIN